MSIDSLFQTAEFAGKPLKNRFVLAPLTRARAGESRIPNALMAEYYRQRATAGMVITEATVVSEQGIGWVGTPGIYSDEMAKGWKLVTDAIHEEGSQAVIQLWHTGRASHSSFHNGQLPVSASAVKLQGDHIHTPEGNQGYETPRALTVDEIKEVVASYRQAAIYAKAAGFDGVEVHAANGYLINQFLDGRSNIRDDEYGGSAENRFRLLKEVLEAILEVLPASAVGVRISPNGMFNDMGFEGYRETYEYVIQQLAAMNLGYLHVMDGLAFGFHQLGEPFTLEEIRPVFKGLIIGNCGYSPEHGGNQVASGNADLVAYGRPYITNPDLPARIKNGWPLAAYDDMSQWYGPSAEGYTDYPVYEPA